MLPILANVEWPSAIVASVLIVCLTIILTAAVIRYKIDEVVKLAGYFTGFLGLLMGAFITYFFTREQAQRQELQIKTIESAFQASEEQKSTAAKRVLKIAAQLKPHVESPETRQAVEYLEFLAKDLGPVWTGMIMESPRPSPSAHATAPDKLFHDLLKQNTASPSPENP